MTIADKLITIADNTPAVAEAVNGSKATVSGTVIRVDDVLNVEHQLEARTTDNYAVLVYGKNLLETASVDATNDKNKVLFQGDITGSFVFSCEFDYSEIKTPNAAQFEFTIDGTVQYMARGSETNFMSKKLSGKLTKVRFLNWGYGVGTVKKLQIEVGTTATAYEPYKGVQTVFSEDDLVTGLNAVSPTMTIATDDYQHGVEIKYFPTSAVDNYDKYQQLKSAEQDLSNLIKEE